MSGKIPTDKGNFVPCCYFPTLSILVDDNARFLQGLQRFLGKEQVAQVFDNPANALNFLSQHVKSENNLLYELLSLKEFENNEEEESVYVDISNISKLLYKKDRFDEPSLIIIDYAMPGMNGLEFSEKVKNQIFLPIKIILLTGEANEQTAVQAFNDGVIDKFIKKSAEDCLEKVKEYIQSLEIKYFQDISRIILDFFRAKSNFVLEDPEFIKLFNKVCQENKIVEYYLIDDSGSFIMLDEQGNITRLIVKTEEDMRSQYELALYDKNVSDETLNKLKNFESLVYFYNKKTVLYSAKDWQLENASMIEGKNKYFYSVIKGTNNYPLENKEIFTYSQYLKTKEIQIQNFNDCKINV